MSYERKTGPWWPILLLLVLLLLTFILESCGYEEPPKAQDLIKTSEPEAEADVAESETEEGELDFDDRDTLKVKVTVGVEVAVEVDEDICTEKCYVWPTLLRKGLAMDQVAYILGEPYDSSNRAGPGFIWKYTDEAGVCVEDYDHCAIYFDGQGLLDLVINIHPSLKNHRSMQ